MADGLRACEGIFAERFAVNTCEYCGSNQNVKACGRCRRVSYCSREHQKKDWNDHRRSCFANMTGGEKRVKVIDEGACNVERRLFIHATQQQQRGVEVRTVTADVNNLFIDRMETAYKSDVFDDSSRSNSDFSDANVDLFQASQGHGSPSGIGISGNDHSRMIGRVDTHYAGKHLLEDYVVDPGDVFADQFKNTGVIAQNTDLSQRQNVLEYAESPTENLEFSGSSENYVLENEAVDLQAPDYSKMKDPKPLSSQISNTSAYISVLESRNKTLSEYVVNCLNAYGVCVIDNFLGKSKGREILSDVMNLCDSEALSTGQIVNAPVASSSNAAIRGDTITWVDGSEYGCSNIKFLISSFDAIMLQCQTQLRHYRIHGRTKAMVAMYPENGKGFLRHVDNPGGDGRCVTCIYYLNENWNSKTDGGLLRVFPERQERVANVEPMFDRLLFFWSDRTNPHEVLPAFRKRYAVTVWYYDYEERKRAVKRYKVTKQPDPKQDVYPLTPGLRK